MFPFVRRPQRAPFTRAGMVSFLQRSAGLPIVAAHCECVPIPARFGTPIREKFTPERTRQEVGRGIFPALSEGAVPRSRELAPSAIAKHRIHDEAAARADRRRRLI